MSEISSERKMPDSGVPALHPQTINATPGRIRGITIEPLDHGFIVRVGCQQLAIEKKSDLIGKLSEYINNPEETEAKYLDRKLF